VIYPRILRVIGNGNPRSRYPHLLALGKGLIAYWNLVDNQPQTPAEAGGAGAADLTSGFY
jgi:hypothetical protein